VLQVTGIGDKRRKALAGFQDAVAAIEFDR